MFSPPFRKRQFLIVFAPLAVFLMYWLAVPGAVVTLAGPPRQSVGPVVVAAGDIACDPETNAKRAPGGVECQSGATADVISGIGPSAVLPLGDNQYPKATLSEFQGSYHLSWGRFLGITRPVPGNHEYNRGGAPGYFAYFGAAAGPPGLGYYSYDIGAWHIIALNNYEPHSPGSPQLLWLEADLAQNPRLCQLAYWHSPRFSSGDEGNDASVAPFWHGLYRAGVDVILNGHDHNYERFDLQNPEANADSRGIRQFVVGTGGRSLVPMDQRERNSQVFSSDAFGVLRLTLGDASYDWQFVPVSGKAFTDSGSTACH